MLALVPALAAIWLVPGFVTQDGPAHVYNAQILAWSFDPGSPFRDIYTIRWQPIPNWVGHLALAGLVAVLPAWTADRILISVTLARVRVGRSSGYAGRVAGGRHLTAAALLAALLAMNITWLLGFTGFLLGACLFPITLGYWWPHRDDLRAGRIAVMWRLLVLGYFCHLVSLGLDGVWPGRPRRGQPAGIGKLGGDLESASRHLAPLIGQLPAAGPARARLSLAGASRRPDAPALGEPRRSLLARRPGKSSSCGRTR